MVQNLGKAQSPVRQVVFDPQLAQEVAKRLAQGLHPSLIAMQLAAKADAAVVAAYVKQVEASPFYKGAAEAAASLRKNEWILDCQRKAWAEQPDAATIPRKHRLDPERFLSEHYANQRPAVLTGLVDDWPALSLWSVDYLEDTVGRETPIEMQRGRQSSKRFEMDSERLKVIAPFSELTDVLRAGERSNDVYVTANNGSANRAAFDPLWSDFGIIEGYTQADPENDGFLWLGPAGTITPFHHDLTNNLLIQVKGRKRVHMIPNWEESRMKTVRRWFTEWTLEAIEAAGEDAPLVMETEIGPGDALYIPVGWWHRIESLDESYSVLFTNFVRPNGFRTGYMA
ncbi:MAG: cupin-like domain-containing protein [Pseudomonadota bacterium]